MGDFYDGLFTFPKEFEPVHVGDVLEARFYQLRARGALSPSKYDITEVCDPYNAFQNIAQKVSVLKFKILIENWKDMLVRVC